MYGCDERVQESPLKGYIGIILRNTQAGFGLGLRVQGLGFRV